MKRTLALLVLVLTASPAFAKPKTKTYPASCDRVWAAVKVATAPPHYNFAMLDDSQKKGVVSTGNTWSGKRSLDITLTGKGDTCTVAIGGAFSGLIHNDKGDLFKRIEKALAETSAESKLAAQPEKQASDKMETDKRAGTIVVGSVPDGAEVYVDGNLVGGAPATLKLVPGKHTIRVTLSGYKDWSRELSVLASSEVRLTATLEQEN